MFPPPVGISGRRPPRRAGTARWRQRGSTVITAAVVMFGRPAALASFGDSGTAMSTFTAHADWAAPVVSQTVIAKSTGYLAGSIKALGSYYVYATIADSGNPASGIAVETTDVSAITAGGAAIPLVVGSYSVGGVSYNYRSALLSAGSLGPGTLSYSITSLDLLAQTRTQSGYPVVVDNTAPTATDIQTVNNSSTAGKAQQGDTITFTFSEQMDPHSILAGWTGASTNVVVRLQDGGCTLVLCSDDSFRIFNAANTSALPFGTIDLNAHNYTGGGLLGSQPDTLFGATATPSTMVQSGSTITITLGTPSGEPADTGSNTTMGWASSTAPYDAAGNAASGNTRNETGGTDREW